jgi:hypothetical protein
MGRYREKTNSGVIAAIIVLICLIAVGVITYFLLSHQSANDGSIGVNVTTGKVKVDIVDENQDSLVGDVLHFVPKENEDTVIFEPGATFYTQGFSVKNDGNISINYRIYISDDDKVDRTEMEKAFDFYITTDPNVESENKLIEFTGTLDAGKNSVTYYLVVHMKESAGNEFQDKLYNGIGITVHATQKGVGAN